MLGPVVIVLSSISFQRKGLKCPSNELNTWKMTGMSHPAVRCADRTCGELSFPNLPGISELLQRSMRTFRTSWRNMKVDIQWLTSEVSSHRVPIYIYVYILYGCYVWDVLGMFYCFQPFFFAASEPGQLLGLKESKGACVWAAWLGWSVPSPGNGQMGKSWWTKPPDSWRLGVQPLIFRGFSMILVGKLICFITCFVANYGRCRFLLAKWGLLQSGLLQTTLIRGLKGESGKKFVSSYFL